jgi:hypothetical protein
VSIQGIFSRPHSGHFLLVLGGFWLALICLGFLTLMREEYSPAKTLSQGASFPGMSSISLSAREPTLILFVHPLCPCTRASFHELEALLTEVSGKVSVVIVFTVPEGLPSDWKQGDLWQSAKTLADVRVTTDRNGMESRRFCVTGSGHCLLYSPSGALLFSGGITASRGHDGENPGRLALLSLITTGHAVIDKTPVFGCSLL